MKGRTLGDEVRDQNSGKQGRTGDRVQEMEFLLRGWEVLKGCSRSGGRVTGSNSHSGKLPMAALWRMDRRGQE